MRIAPKWRVIGNNPQPESHALRGVWIIYETRAQRIDLSMSGDISPFETIAYSGGGSDNFRASDHPPTGLVGGQKGVKEVCAFVVDHDLARS